MKDTAESLQQKLRQIDDYESKGLMRAEEAAAQREQLRRRLLQVLLPDTPAPRPPWRVRLRSVLLMVVVVGGVSAYLLTEHAGLNRRAIEMLDAAKAVHAERLAHERAGADASAAPDAQGVFPGEAPASAPADVAPLLAGRIELAPALAGQVAPDDAVFVTVRLPDDPAGLPLAAIRKRAADLPFDFSVGEAEIVGTAPRFMQAPRVVVLARISKAAAGLARPGDLVGATTTSPWSRGVVVRIDDVVPAR